MDNEHSVSVSSDSSGELHVLWHDGNSLGVDGAEVGIFEKTDHVGLGGLLEGEDSGGLESKVALEVRSDLSDESLERKLSDEELGGFLESSDLSKCDSAWSESVSSLHSNVGWRFTLGLLVGDVLSWLLGAGILSCGVLGSCHFELNVLLLFIALQVFKWFHLKIWLLIGQF